MIVAAHLPIGSPERAAFFAEARLTFCEDWKTTEQEVRLAIQEAKGDLYFVRAGNAVKVGRTINIVNRLGKMQADNHEKLECLALLNGRGHQEGMWHGIFRKHRIHGEWFTMSTDIEAAVEEAKRQARAEATA